MSAEDREQIIFWAVVRFLGCRGPERIVHPEVRRGLLTIYGVTESAVQRAHDAPQYKVRLVWEGP